MFKPARLLIRGKSTSIFYAICYSTPILFQGFMFYPQFFNASSVYFETFETRSFLSRKLFSLISLNKSNFKAFINSCWMCIKLLLDMQTFFNASFSKLFANPDLTKSQQKILFLFASSG